MAVNAAEVGEWFFPTIMGSCCIDIESALKGAWHLWVSHLVIHLKCSQLQENSGEGETTSYCQELINPKPLPKFMRLSLKDRREESRRRQMLGSQPANTITEGSVLVARNHSQYTDFMGKKGHDHTEITAKRLDIQRETVGRSMGSQLI